MKRLYRSRSDVMIAGVCSGLAKYLNVDVTIVRLIFVLLLFTATGGFWIYLVLWVVVPIEPSAQPDSMDVESKPAREVPRKIAAPKKNNKKEIPEEESLDETTLGESQ